VRKVSRSGHTTTIAGNGEVGFADGLGAAARFSHPFGVALDKEGCLYIADFNNNAIRKLSPSGAVTTIAGNGVSGFSDGSALQARFKAPYGIAVDKDGIMYVSDSHNHAIRKVIPGTVHGEATVSTIAGAGAVWSDGIAGFADGPGEQARFNRPAGIAIDSEKNIIVSDSRNNRIRKIESASGGFVVTTIAGASEAGDANGTGMAARFWDPSAVVLDGKGRVLVAEKERVDILRIVDGEFAGPLWFG
jgi:sugar lactone lactonase YvrE